MELVQVIGIILILTALFALGGKIALYFKNREISLVKENYERLLAERTKEQNSLRQSFSEDAFKQTQRLEEHYLQKLSLKEQEIKELLNELEAMQSWKSDLEIKFAKYEGAAQGSQQHIVIKLLDLNQKLNQALNAKWKNVEEHLVSELNTTLIKMKEIFSDAEKMHRDGIEIIAEYESRLPDDIKKKVREELVKLPQ